jgi:hypothetical protein
VWRVIEDTRNGSGQGKDIPRSLENLAALSVWVTAHLQLCLPSEVFHKHLPVSEADSSYSDAEGWGQRDPSNVSSPANVASTTAYLVGPGQTSSASTSPRLH